MQLTKEDIEKYRDIYKGYFGKELGWDKASGDAYSLIRLMELIYKPITKAQYEQLQERRRETGDLRD